MNSKTLAAITILCFASCTSLERVPFHLAETARFSDDAGTRDVARRAEARVAVNEVHTSMHRIHKTTEAMGGFLAFSDSTEDTGLLRLTIPSLRLDDFLLDLADVGTVEQTRIVAEDVTERTTTLETKLADLRKKRDDLRRRRETLIDSREIVTLERELASLQTQIDEAASTLSDERDDSAMAAVELRLYRPVVLGPVSLLVRAVGIGVRKLFVWS